MEGQGPRKKTLHLRPGAWDRSQTKAALRPDLRPHPTHPHRGKAAASQDSGHLPTPSLLIRLWLFLPPSSDSPPEKYSSISYKLFVL